MTTKAEAIPEGFRGATPYLCVRGGAAAIEFYTEAFGATELMRLAEPDGRIGHAEIRIGDATIMLSDEYPEMEIVSPQSLGGTPVLIHLYVEDVDALFARAVTAGAIVKRTPADQFYGDRSGTLVDPFGHRWMLATHKEDVSSAEMQKRYEELYGAK
jgi:PhnB protein